MMTNRTQRYDEYNLLPTAGLDKVEYRVGGNETAVLAVPVPFHCHVARVGEINTLTHNICE